MSLFASLPPASADTKRSDEYVARINGREVFVHALPGFAGGTVSWVSVDWNPEAGGALECRVTASRLVDAVSVRPSAAGVEARLEDERTAVFTITRPGHYFVKWDDEFQLPFHLFVQPPHEAPSGGDVIVFGPGEHRPGVIRLRSGQTLYLAPGAEVHGVVVAEDASDIRICGRGILRGSHVPFGGTREERYMIELRRCRRVVVEGVCVVDGFGWTIIAHHCEDVAFRWLKVITERLWSTDGINPCASRRVSIEDCFIRSKDDCVAVKGLDWEHPDARDWVAMHDIAVRRCVLWSENNNALVVGAETRATRLERVVFEDCDILRVCNTCGDDAGALAIVALDDTVIRDVVFRRIRIEHALGPLFNVGISAGVFGIPPLRRPEGAEISAVLFEDVELVTGPSRRSFVRGLDASRRVRGVCFRRVVVRGEPVRSAADLRLVSNAHAYDITFE
jgi:hypothetical protein